jgi:Zn-dependent protease with chaperone function
MYVSQVKPIEGALVPAPPVARLRHRAEVPVLIAGGVITVGAICIVLGYLILGEDLPSWAMTVALVPILPLTAAIYGIRWSYWNTVSNGVEVTPQQLPEIYQIFTELAHRMEIYPVPRLYVANGNGLLNAYATKCQLRRNYVVIYSDLLDIAFEFGDMDAIRFILAHELGHIKAGHVKLWRLLITTVPRLVAFTSTISRAQEYTADRIGSFYAPEGARKLTVLFGGKRVYRHVDFDAYLASIQNHKNGFWLRVVNYFADHAVGFRRMAALARVKDEGWDVHGKML